MHLTDGRLILSASDLTGFLECPHLTQQELAATRGELVRPERDDPELELMARHGTEHEQAHLDAHALAGKSVVRIETWGATVEAYWKAREQTLEAMRSGIDVIYQATLFDGRWLGYADFLEKVDVASELGAHSYEVVDTKLARSAKAAALLQTSLYSELVAGMQGTSPEWMHLALGDGTRPRFRVSDYRAYLHHAKAKLEAVTAATPVKTYPEPVEHCGVCRWNEVCKQRWRDDDSLVLVAGLQRSQARKLGASGVNTVAGLATTDADLSGTGIGAATLVRVRNQARLQVQERETGVPAYELLPPERPELGLALLPTPTEADLFFDMESDPWAQDGGLEYLFGVFNAAGGFTPIWAHDRAEEKKAFEDFVDLVIGRLDANPEMHVYHYAPYEPSALKRLMGRYGTREAEVDRLLRGEVLVDLYRVVKQSLLASRESYSLKEIEALYMGKRDDAIAEAGSSIVAYERWIDNSDQAILDEIAAYNEQDCRSTWLLRNWLEERRPDAEKKFAIAIPRPDPQPSEPSAELQEWERDIEELSVRLTDGAPVAPPRFERVQSARWLLGQQLWWHRREQKSDWWGFYERLKMTEEELIADSEAIGGVEYYGTDGPYKHSLLHRYRFPPQDHKLSLGLSPFDPRTKKPAGEVHEIDNVAGWVVLRRGKGSDAPHPAALIPPTPIEDRVLRDAIRRVAESVAGQGIESDGPYRAIRDLLLLAPPRSEDSYLAIQGPPGTGKTTLGAEMIVDRLIAGRRVGITAISHKVIGNLLDAVCREAERRGYALRAMQKADEDQRCRSEVVKCTGSNADVDDALAAGEVDLVAGTAWLFARDEIEGKLDDLFIDEAGQMSLTNVIAASTCASNIVLLGDPNQLRQPSKGSHPEGSDLSALDHVLDGAQTIPDDRGRFLSKTWRMHPDVCRFISEIAYENRLESAPECSRQRVGGEGEMAGTGLRYRPVEHIGNRTSSKEEAGVVADLFNDLLGRPWTDRNGNQRGLTIDDILIVAPYNAHVSLLANRLPLGARVGTVDKFQGQEAPVVIYSMATSTPAEAPRGIDFLYSLHRLNVAISRAQGMAILVCNPVLLDVKAHTPAQMRLANALCRLVEIVRKDLGSTLSHA
ncbi:MAG: TM0106 family RecB-like putative nuclease [Chloroflexi bacterium]|nr:MAG: TM0106 family RecB-like putative nuclease [Chloroflexota bacterium]